MKKKPINVQRIIELPKAGIADRLTISPDGQVQIFDHDGNLVTPASDRRSTLYPRKKGSKVQSQTDVSSNYASIDGLEELSRLESFFVIDTNTRMVADTKISVAFFFQCKVVKEGEKYRCVSCEQFAHSFEYHDVEGNPEMLALLTVAMGNAERIKNPLSTQIGFVTDSELGRHVPFSLREEPIYGEHFLPQGFQLIYASADTGNELLNQLIRECDRQARSVLDRIEREGLVKSHFLDFPGLPEARYQYRKFNDLKIDSGLIGGMTIHPTTTITVEFHE